MMNYLAHFHKNHFLNLALALSQAQVLELPLQVFSILSNQLACLTLNLFMIIFQDELV